MIDKESLFNRYQGAIIIGKEESRSFFVGLKKDIPNLDCSFYSVNEIIDMFAFAYDDAALSYLRYAYEFNPIVAEETLIIVSLLSENNYHSSRLRALMSLRDDLLSKGLLKKQSGFAKIFEGKNILYFGLKTALPLSKRLGELHNMALSFDLPYEDKECIDPDEEKYRKLSYDERKELSLY